MCNILQNANEHVTNFNKAVLRKHGIVINCDHNIMTAKHFEFVSKGRARLCFAYKHHSMLIVYHDGVNWIKKKVGPTCQYLGK